MNSVFMCDVPFPGLSRQSFESSDSNSSAISSPGSTAYHPAPTAPPPGDSRNNGMIPWTQGAATFPGAEGSDDDDGGWYTFISNASILVSKEFLGMKIYHIYLCYRK